METKGGFYITQIKQLQDRIFEKMLIENDIEISSGQGRILFVLWKEDHHTVSEISQKISLAKNTVSIVIDGMVQKGLLERVINPENRRQTIISLTEHAKSIGKNMKQYRSRWGFFFIRDFREKKSGSLKIILSESGILWQNMKEETGNDNERAYL